MSRREAMSKVGELMYSPKADGESCLLYTDLSKSTFIWRGSSSSWTLSSQKFGLDPGVLIEAEFMKDGFLVPIRVVEPHVSLVETATSGLWLEKPWWNTIEEAESHCLTCGYPTDGVVAMPLKNIDTV